jgi:uncharacterized membrane protein
VFFLALYSLYSALQIARASDVAPTVAGVSALTTIIASSALLESSIEASILPALVLAAGTAIISYFHFSARAVMCIVISGMAFGTAVIIGKLVYERTDFLDGFFWMRVISALCAVSLLIVPSLRARMLHTVRSATRGGWFIVTSNKILAGCSSILFAFAISAGDAAVVNAFTGLQFAFLFLFALLFARSMPRRVSDELFAHGGWHTAVGIALIMCGLGLLAFTV